MSTDHAHEALMARVYEGEPDLPEGELLDLHDRWVDATSDWTYEEIRSELFREAGYDTPVAGWCPCGDHADTILSFLADYGIGMNDEGVFYDLEDEDAEDGEEDPDEPGPLAGTVILMDVDQDDERLLVIPVDVARGELSTYATLQHAGTYRDVLADDGAVETVVEALGRRLDEQAEDDAGSREGVSARELFGQRVAEDVSFSTDAVFGEEGWRAWCPDHRAATEQFLSDRAPQLWERFRKDDNGWGIDHDLVERLAIADQDQIVAELRALGCEILWCPDLNEQYRNPDRDLAARIDAGEWPHGRTETD